MDFIELFKTIKEEGFDEDTALLTTIAQAIHISIFPENEDYTEPGRYTSRMEKIIKDTLWQHDDVLDRIMLIESRLHDFDLQKFYNDVTKSTNRKTLKQLIEEKE